ncbi:MAG: N-acetylglucosamine-6-phosphate deacetylase [Tidjanibacter sp.]|nr:N-acetylglucosamine-6-phosphate deacetylase [Tidjanibacter sp.]MBR3854040.1 N-acetylglucosamine-6-phosphate deacetylase [Tidjanibacter sp.]
MKRISIINGTVISGGRSTAANVLLEGGKIAYVGPEVPEVGAEDVVIDARGRLVSAGFIDLHTHGAGGADFMDGTVEAYEAALVKHAEHGTTLLYPTTLSSTTESLYEALQLYKEAKKANLGGAAMGGLHLEGPYFAYEMKGAQDPRFLRNPSPEEYVGLLNEADGDIARWSLAPELEGAPEMGAELRKRGVLMAMGHTNATFDECEVAYKAGFTHLTHFYSCMSTITRRNAYRYAGVIEWGYYTDGATVEIIGDGIHVPQSLLKLMFKVKGADNIALITDSMRGAGMPDGVYLLGGVKDGQEVVVEDGVAKLLDRSAFAGSVATMDRVVRTVHQLTELPLEEIVKSATEVPARIMGVSENKGSVEVGKDADVVIFDENVNICTTIVEGRIVYDNR